MPPRKKAQLAFASALLLLFLSGLATYFATRSLIASERWVIHTHEVQAAIGNIDSAISRAGRARSGYILDGQEDFLSQFDAALLEIPPALQNLRELTKDNPDQQKLWSRLEDVTNRRLSLFRVSIRLHKGNADDAQAQADLARQGLPLSAEMTSITRDMRENEHRLLDSREKNSHRLLIMTVVTLVVAFVLALELFAVNYRLLSAELTAREQAEQTVRDSEESLRRLTGRLLQLQDAERRKFSRELHDSLGQYLAGAKMNLEMFAAQHNDAFLAEAIKSLDQAMVETRTISHLLHPPLLDEAGFSSAAKWYLEGFGQRSGINV
jgi:CHASE3 domain sensor protein